LGGNTLIPEAPYKWIMYTLMVFLSSMKGKINSSQE